MDKKNKKYYQKKHHKQYHNNKKQEPAKKVITYEELMQAELLSKDERTEDNYNKTLIIKYIAVSVVLFAIIIGSLILFRKI